MTSIDTSLPTISGAIYITIALIHQKKYRSRYPENSIPSTKSHIWGLLFATLFFFATPIWWWRYGFWRTLILISTVLGILIIANGSLLANNVVDFIGTFGYRVVRRTISIATLVGLGLWVAHNDRNWRQNIISKRMSK